jgi:hypothetical protein
MTRAHFGSGYKLMIGPDDQIPDQSSLIVGALGTFRVLNSDKMYGPFFKFIDYEFEINVVTATHTGEVTSLPDKKELREDYFSFELTAFPIKTAWTIKANLIITIQKKSTGEIFTPRYEFELGPLHQDILGFGVNEELRRELDIKLNTTAPDPNDQYQISQMQDGESINAFFTGIKDNYSFISYIDESGSKFVNEMRNVMQASNNPTPFDQYSEDYSQTYRPWFFDPIKIQKRQENPYQYMEEEIDIIIEYRNVITKFCNDQVQQKGWEALCDVIKEIFLDLPNNPPSTDHSTSEYLIWSLTYTLRDYAIAALQFVENYMSIERNCMEKAFRESSN